ncbi:MAG: protein TolR [Deltaproteobacteria bacterium]|jgi:biopolymer transport protein TolR|nr:protein TolR [Deltaproteobacteria bacterium]MDO9210809.1 protein TolR [Deltaproteobacteria bacterium]MDP3038518.1 protein TolR [Deltaproteobacteria bacterium]
MQGPRSENRAMSDINVTPLVDVMLVLLIIFMVTAPMMQQGVDVDLPQTTSRPIEDQEERIVITINSKREVFINQEKVDPLLLRRRLERSTAAKLNKEVLLRADRSVPYGFVVQTMAEIKNAGIEKLGMVTEPLEERR